jgi:hypothetical protein
VVVLSCGTQFLRKGNSRYFSHMEFGSKLAPERAKSVRLKMKKTVVNILKGVALPVLAISALAILSPVAAVAQRGGGHGWGGGHAGVHAQGFSGGGVRGYSGGGGYVNRGYSGGGRYYRGGGYLGFGFGYGGYPYYSSPYYGYPYAPGYAYGTLPPCVQGYDNYGNPVPGPNCYSHQAPYPAPQQNYYPNQQYQQQYQQPQQQYYGPSQSQPYSR